MKNFVLFTAYAFIFSVGGYAYGYYVGSTEPRLDRDAINRAVYSAMMEQ